MEIREHYDAPHRELHVHTVMTDEQVQNAVYEIPRAITQRIVDEMVAELLPLVREQVLKTLDYTEITKLIQATITKQLLDEYMGRYVNSLAKVPR